jgi:hypothetical protein
LPFGGGGPQAVGRPFQPVGGATMPAQQRGDVRRFVKEPTVFSSNDRTLMSWTSSPIITASLSRENIQSFRARADDRVRIIRNR